MKFIHLEKISFKFRCSRFFECVFAEFWKEKFNFLFVNSLDLKWITNVENSFLSRWSLFRFRNTNVVSGF